MLSLGKICKCSHVFCTVLIQYCIPMWKNQSIRHSISQSNISKRPPKHKWYIDTGSGTTSFTVPSQSYHTCSSLVLASEPWLLGMRACFALGFTSRGNAWNSKGRWLGLAQENFAKDAWNVAKCTEAMWHSKPKSRFLCSKTRPLEYTFTCN